MNRAVSHAKALGIGLGIRRTKKPYGNQALPFDQKNAAGNVKRLSHLLTSGLANPMLMDLTRHADYARLSMLARLVTRLLANVIRVAETAICGIAIDSALMNISGYMILRMDVARCAR